MVNGTRDITGDTDLRLCKFFGLSERYFLRLQNAFDTLEAKRRIAAQVDDEEGSFHRTRLRLRQCPHVVGRRTVQLVDAPNARFPSVGVVAGEACARIS
jgi:hypothetical protein